jgi:hypothetical protein
VCFHVGDEVCGCLVVNVGSRAMLRLVEQHAHQQRERVVVQQRVGDRILDKLQFRHPHILKPCRKYRVVGISGRVEPTTVSVKAFGRQRLRL